MLAIFYISTTLEFEFQFLIYLIVFPGLDIRALIFQSIFFWFVIIFLLLLSFTLAFYFIGT